MRIAIDAMGGDYAPGEIILGALQALEEDSGLRLVLVGKESEMRACLPPKYPTDRVDLLHCQEIIAMDEHPATAYRRKKDASITVATRLVKEKRADAVVSAGSTGAQMVAALFGLGRIKGVDRPAIVTVLPTLQGPKLLLDAGANADCKPENLLQFAQMGMIYAEKILGLLKPKISLVNIGEEPTKGNELSIKTYDILHNRKELNFIGNIEGRNILSGKADVMVCDGFVGNTVLKVIEGTAAMLTAILKEELQKSVRSKAGALLLKPGLKAFKARMDYAEYGGAPLLGVNGISIICHGSSKALAVKNAVRVATECVRSDFVRFIEDQVK